MNEPPIDTPGTAHARIDKLELDVRRLWLEVGALALCLLALAGLHLLARVQTRVG